MSLAPGDAEYHALLAEHLEGVGTDPLPEFVTASQLSPSDARYWIRLGFNAESKGNYTSAEQYLLRAATVSRKFDPAWALTNFYFRRGNAAEFWKWADRALSMSYGDRSAMFRLFWEMSPDAEFIRSHIPAKPEVLSNYLQFVENRNKPGAGGPVARDLARLGDETDVPVLMSFCGASAVQDGDTAEFVWNELTRRRLIAGTILDAASGHVVGDPEFRLISEAQCYSWRLFTAVDGIVARRDDAASGLRIVFGGNQPEEALIAEELLPAVTVHATLRLNYTAAKDSGAALAGLFMQVVSAADSRVLAEADSAASGSLEFEGSGAPLLLRLRYRRSPGTTMARGGITVTSVRSELVP